MDHVVYRVSIESDRQYKLLVLVPNSLATSICHKRIIRIFAYDKVFLIQYCKEYGIVTVYPVEDTTIGWKFVS